jgi:DNA gyrase subunit A
MDQQIPARLPVNIEDEMKRSYMDYAMSVIIGRALPDVRDGLKPANRRVLFAMRQMGLASNRPYRKCAKIVGEVIGNYHPHGDAPAYDTLVRLAQDFNMRYPLVDGQGNFGRWTAIRRRVPLHGSAARIAGRDDDGRISTRRPSTSVRRSTRPRRADVLPTPFPSLLVNGSTGIAVGMATSIPPHNMREVIDGVLGVHRTQARAGRSASARCSRAFPGPTFRRAAPSSADRGSRARTARPRRRRGRGQGHRRRIQEETIASSIVVTEIPYQVNKSALISDIAELVRDKKIEGISDLRDESDRDGMRIVIELKRGELPDVVLNNLYKHTKLQMSYGITLLAIAGGRPRVLSLLAMIDHFIDFRRKSCAGASSSSCGRREARAHILEGLKIALDHLDRVITLIRSSKNPVEARTGLITQFGLSLIQSQAILDMQLQRLTGSSGRRFSTSSPSS